MTFLPHPDQRLRLVADANVFISALISPGGAARELVAAAVDGRVTFILSPLLITEILTRAARGKFRRWFSEQDAQELMRALTLLSEPAQDPDRTGWVPMTRDPQDEYLVALALHTEATFPVSGDKDLLAMQSGSVTVRTIRATLDAIDFTHPWGETFAPAVKENESFVKIAAEGNVAPIRCASEFITAVQGRDVPRLPYLVTPESLPTWLDQLDSVQETVQTYPSLTSRPEYLTLDVAVVKIVPDSGVSMFATHPVLLPDARFLTLQHRPLLPDPEGLGGWRVHSIGDVHWPVDDMPTVERGTRSG